MTALKILVLTIGLGGGALWMGAKQSEAAVSVLLCEYLHEGRNHRNLQ